MSLHPTIPSCMNPRLSAYLLSALGFAETLRILKVLVPAHLSDPSPFLQDLVSTVDSCFSRAGSLWLTTGWGAHSHPKPGCLHTNLSFHLTSLSLSSVAVFSTPSRLGGCACHRTSDLWGCFRETMEGVAQQALHLGGTVSPCRGTLMLLPILAFLHPAPGHIVLHAGSSQRKSPASTSWSDVC